MAVDADICGPQLVLNEQKLSLEQKRWDKENDIADARLSFDMERDRRAMQDNGAKLALDSKKYDDEVLRLKAADDRASKTVWGAPPRTHPPSVCNTIMSPLKISPPLCIY